MLTPLTVGSRHAMTRDHLLSYLRHYPTTTTVRAARALHRPAAEVHRVLLAAAADGDVELTGGEWRAR